MWQFWYPRSRDRELRHKKKVIFGFLVIETQKKHKKIAYNSKTAWPAKLKSGHNVGAYECFVQTEFGGAQSHDQNFTGRK